MNWKGLLVGIVLVTLVGIGGFLYRAGVEKPSGPIACTADAKVCPDGTGLSREGPECRFPSCPLPNVEFPEARIAFAIPPGYVEDTGRFGSDPATIAAYVSPDNESPAEVIIVQRYIPKAEQSIAEFIRENAILDPSGLPAPPTAFTSTTISRRTYSVVQIGRFEAVVSAAYYLDRQNELLRFDAISLSVLDWTDPKLDVTKLKAQQDLRALLETLQGI
jgi:hypothetical protein